MANIREHCSWVHLYEPEKATAKAKDIVKVAVSRAKWLYSQDEEQISVTDAALVIGGGVAGMQAALDAADFVAGEIDEAAGNVDRHDIGATARGLGTPDWRSLPFKEVQVG